MSHGKEGPDRVFPNIEIIKNWEAFLTEEREVDIFYATWAKSVEHLDKVRCKCIIYDSLDDFPDWRKYEPSMIGSSDLVLTTSQVLFEKRKQEHPHVFLVRNGCCRSVIGTTYNRPRELAGLKGPIVGFVGALGSWVDTELLEVIASQFTLVVIGPEFGKRAPRGSIYLGIKKYDELFSYYRYIDVGVIPFIDCDISRAANPIKMYEYLSAGKPVVSMNIPECNQYPGVVFNSETPDRFMSDLYKVVDMNVYDEAIKIARENTWERRYDSIIEHIKNTVGGIIV
jgi:glycosyltransferase involved in cell wall biosynthesis